MVVIELLASLLLGGVFLFSAVPKLRHPRGFVLTVLQYQILPARLSRLYGWLLPPLELFLALLFFGGTALRSASVLTGLLLLSFLIAVGVNLARGRRLECGCFGKAAKRQIGWGLLLQDGLLLAVAVALCFVAQTWASLESWSVFRLLGLSSIMIPFLLLAFVTLVVASASRFGVRAAFFRRRGGIQLQR